MRLQEISQPVASPDTQSGSNPYRRAASPGLFAVARRRAEYQALQIDREKKHGHIRLPQQRGDEASFDGLGEGISMTDKQALRQLATDAHELGIIKRYSKGLEAQRKFYAAATPLVIRALLDELEALQSFRTAYMEWSDKTDWVQTDKRLDVIKPWGKHRADVLKLYIDHLESSLESRLLTNADRDIAALRQRIAELEAKLQTADKLQDSAFRHGLQYGFSYGQTNDQAGFEQCLAAYSSRGKDNG